jgi:nonsense-mediated mRNA decay protein 3
VARASDLSKNYFVRTHLGNYLHPGDSVLGYMLTGSNFNNDEFSEIEASNTYGSTVPDVVLVKKHYPNRRKTRKRNWKLKRMDQDSGELLRGDQGRLETDFDMFLRDVEEDEELRATLALYKNTRKNDAMSVADSDMSGDDDGIPQINTEELLDDFEDLTIQDNMGDD